MKHRKLEESLGLIHAQTTCGPNPSNEFMSNIKFISVNLSTTKYYSWQTYSIMLIKRERERKAESIHKLQL